MRSAIKLSAIALFVTLIGFPCFAQTSANSTQQGVAAVGNAAAQNLPPIIGGPAAKPGDIAVGRVAAPIVVQNKQGGIIDFQSFGWLSPIINDVVQFAVLALLGWFFKSKLGASLDDSSRDALRTFAINAASSLLADGAVTMAGKSITINNANLASEINSAASRVPDALKRFGIDVTTDAGRKKLGDMIEDHLAQTPAGAAIVSAASAGAAPAPAA